MNSLYIVCQDIIRGQKNGGDIMARITEIPHDESIRKTLMLLTQTCPVVLRIRFISLTDNCLSQAIDHNKPLAKTKSTDLSLMKLKSAADEAWGSILW